MTRLQRFNRILELLTEMRQLLEPLHEAQRNRKYYEQQAYEQMKARGQCVASLKCKSKPVPFHTLCSYHLLKAAQNSARRDAKKPSRKKNDNRVRIRAKQGMFIGGKTNIHLENN